MERAYLTFDLGSSDRDAGTPKAISWAFDLYSAKPASVLLWEPHREVLTDLPGTASLVRKGLVVLSDRPGRGPRPVPQSGQS